MVNKSKVVVGTSIIVLLIILAQSYSLYIYKTRYEEQRKVCANVFAELVETIKSNDDKSQRIDSLNKEVEQLKKKPVQATRGATIERQYSLPGVSTSFKSYMDYKAITNRSSNQYKLQIDKDTFTDDLGFRRHNEDYIVAMGTYYGKNIGKRFSVELHNGYKFNAILGDIKADQHTNTTNQYRQHGKTTNIIEFIVDSNKLPKIAKQMGDISYTTSNLEGEIKSINSIK